MENPSFQSLLFELVYIKAKNECGLSTKTNVVKYLSQILIISLGTLKKIYLEDSKNYQIETLNILSRYLGFKDFADFFTKKRPVLDTLDLRSKNIAFRSPILYTYKYFQKAFFLLRNEPKLFSYRIHEILESIFPFTKVSSSSLFMINTISLNFDESNVLFCVFPFSLSSSFEDVLIKYRVILNDIKSDNKITSDPSIFLTFLTNLILTKKQKSIIEHETKMVLNDSFKGEVDFFDIEDFIEFYSLKVDVVIDDILNEYHEQYKYKTSKNLKSNFYIEDVPFVLSNSKAKHKNPAHYIKNNLIDITTEIGMIGNTILKNIGKESLSRGISWNIVIGEFGFGKTTLFLNLEKQFYDSQYKFFFLPLAQLDENAFNSTDNFLKQLFLIIREKSLDFSNTSDLLFYDYLKSILMKEQRIMFLIDGIDEHFAAYSNVGLQNIFNCINELQTDCLISLRKEFWDDRTGDLQSIFSKYRKYNSVINLIDWTNKEILNFIKEFELSEGVLNNKNILQFKQIVKDNNFEEFFGDIPKRPLFLKMILQDVVAGNITSKSLQQLYENYLIEKFIRDREGSFIDNKSGRLLKLENEKDRLGIINLIWKMMKSVAEKMIVIENNELKLKSFILEEELNTIIESSSNNISSREILLNTVLIPIAQRSVQGLKLIFAHRSFQEYYTALYLIEEKSILKKNISISKEILRFLN